MRNPGKLCQKDAKIAFYMRVGDAQGSDYKNNRNIKINTVTKFETRMNTRDQN